MRDRTIPFHITLAATAERCFEAADRAADLGDDALADSFWHLGTFHSRRALACLDAMRSTKVAA